MSSYADDVISRVGARLDMPADDVREHLRPDDRASIRWAESVAMPAGRASERLVAALAVRRLKGHE